ncbi:cardiolipin synthase [Lacicoccus alkaliphilus]|uniref:Cardiolipin synthase n=1 Tax=Lacicoccus alkaliphilus DSM 16010 TaxID=1123231 RepID=A0A1M7DS81_9BACL|nr:cardiolipin synthase [Salinicoccus alkaliphilus]SHL82039.1 cardiolipin synthase [Salinicoccus alkaliphilus DSM 16010]
MDAGVLYSLLDSPLIVTVVTILVFGINFVLAIGMIFLERRSAQSIWAWLLVLFFLPVIGFLLYLLFGGTIRSDKIFKMDKSQEIELEDLVTEQLEKISDDALDFTDPVAEKHKQQIHMLLHNNQSFITTNNEITTFTDMHDKFDAMLEDIEAAEDHINFQYYAFKLDDIGTRIYNALLKKQREGVRVRILYDDIGSRSLALRHFKDIEEAGGAVEAFFSSWMPLINPRMNYRNHRKIVVIDGQIGYIGGSNVADKYLGRDPKMGAWRDTHLRVTGGAVQALQLRFMMDWNSHNNHLPMEYEEKYFPDDTHDGNTAMQISSSGPDETHQEIKYGYLKMIYSAQDSIYIQSPYFIPDQAVTEALHVAILSGVKVNIMMPSFTDHPLVYWGSYSNAGAMAKMGADVYLYTPGFFHPKMVMIDDEIVSVGTTNIDNRSFLLNFEINAFIYDSGEAVRQRKIFEEDIKDCEPLTIERYEQRSLWIKFKEGVANLIEPLL